MCLFCTTELQAFFLLFFLPLLINEVNLFMLWGFICHAHAEAEYWAGIKAHLMPFFLKLPAKFAWLFPQMMIKNTLTQSLLPLSLSPSLPNFHPASLSLLLPLLFSLSPPRFLIWEFTRKRSDPMGSYQLTRMWPASGTSFSANARPTCSWIRTLGTCTPW